MATVSSRTRIRSNLNQWEGYTSYQIVLEDLKQSATVGVKGVDPKRRPVRIFIDTVAMYGDILQATAFKDVLGHSANALCTLCGPAGKSR